MDAVVRMGDVLDDKTNIASSAFLDKEGWASWSPVPASRCGGEESSTDWDYWIDDVSFYQ
jgi:hypothetical protein